MGRRPGGGRRPGAADGPRLRAAASWSRTRRPPASRRSPPGGAAARGSSSPASRRSSSTRSRRTTFRSARWSCAVGARVAQGTLLRELLGLGYTPVLEVAGRGEFARRGGIVDVFPPSAELPVRIESFGDEIDSLRAFDPTDQRTTGKVDRVTLLPASEFLVPEGGADGLTALLGAIVEAAAGAPRRGPGAAPRAIATPRGRAANLAPRRSATPRRSGRRCSRRRPPWTTWPPGTLFVIDEPGDIGEAAEFLWRQADERRADLLAAERAAEGLAADAPAAARLEAPPARRADPRADLGIGGEQCDRGRRQVVRRPVRLARAAAPAGTRRADRRGRGALARRGRSGRRREGRSQSRSHGS